MSERRGTKALETWCKRLTEGYPGVKVENMTTSWRDGLAFCAIIHHFRPDLIDFASLTPSNIYYNNSLAFNVAERQLGIPALLDAEDMVMYTVPDRLSILTYLSQFYQVFGNQSAVAGNKQGSSQRIVPKRSAISTISSDRGMISSASSSPPTKMAFRSSTSVTGSGLNRREPCAKCGFPVFLAERLNVGTKLYHRTCFRCARCNNQLSLANCYETEIGEYCCETCPDEEQPDSKISKFDSLDNVTSLNDLPEKFNSSESLSQATDSKKLDILGQTGNRSLSDEEKSKGLLKFDDDEYSADFEHALEEKESVMSKARNHFLSTHLLNEDAVVPKINEDIPPPLPESEPPDLVSSSASLTTEENLIPLVPDSDVNIPEEEDSLVNKTNLTINEDQPETASAENEETKDNNRSSLVKSRMLLFEVGNKESTISTSISKDKNRDSTSKIEESTVPSTQIDISESITVPDSTTTQEDIEEATEKSHHNSVSSLKIEENDEANITVRSELENSDNIVLYSSVLSENSPLNEDNNISSKEENLLSKSVIEDLSGDQTVVSINASIFEDSPCNNEEQYPDDLNPFGDEEEEEDPPKDKLKNIKQIIKPSMEDLTIITPPTKEEKRHSTNPFGSSDEEEETEEAVVKQKPPRPPLPTARPDSSKKVLEAPKVNLNPFWSDGEEPSEEEINAKPVPMPRSKHLSTPEPKPRRSGLSNSASHYDSNSSLSSMNSSIGHTPGRKKKPAPPPPKGGISPEGSKQSSPSTSTQPSPKLTPRTRKNRKAPLPPSSTPFLANFSVGDSLNESSIMYNTSEKTEGKSDVDETIIISPTGSDIEKEKISKDEKNRNRQSQTIASPVLSDSDSLSLSQQGSSSTDKSTHGKWKRKKGPAPARPVPQRRQIRPLPLTELRRELDIIEMQQQGLEKQGVKLEQLIREKCEAPGTNDETALTPEVEDLVLELFELVNEKNELFRRQAELMYLRRQQRLEEEHADLEYQIRCLMDRPERNKTDTDKAREEELINRLLEVVERRNEIVECLEMDRVREAEEDQSINFHLSQLASKKEEESLESPIKLSKKEKKKMKKEKKLKEKGKTLDADKDIDESETSLNVSKEKKKKKWF